MVLKFNKDKAANVLLIAFLVLIFFGKILGIGLVLFYPAIICAFVAICLGDNNFRVGTCLMLVPNIRVFDGLQISFIINVLIALPVFAYILETKRINFTALMHVLIIGTWDLMHSLAFNQANQILANFSTVIILYYVECVLTDSAVKLNYSEIARKFSFGCLYSGLVFMLYMALFGSMPLFTYISLWRLSGFAGDPNYYSLYVCVAIAMLFIIAEKHKIRDYIYLFTMIGITLLTASKMSLVTILIILIYFVFRSLYGILSASNRFARRVVLIGAALGAIFSGRIVDSINNTLIRLQEKNGDTIDIDTITSNRYMIQSFYTNEIFTQPMLLLFGYGLQYNETGIYKGFQHIAHNTYLDVILSWGLVGVVILFAVFFRIVKMMNKNRLERLTVNHFLPMIVTGVTFFALSCLSATMFWWIICAALLPLKGLYSDETAYILHRSRLQRRKFHFNVHGVAHGANVS